MYNIRCPKCQSPMRVLVTHSGPSRDTVIRARECTECLSRFETREAITREIAPGRGARKRGEDK